MTSSLPNPSMSFTPFDPLPASQLNDIVENIEALATGDAFNSDAIIKADTISEKTAGAGVTIDGLQIKDGSITGLGGFKIGIIDGASVLNTTGNKSITGVGFTPKLVRFTVIYTTNAAYVGMAFGSMTSSVQYYSAISGKTTQLNRNASTSKCIGWLNGDTGAVSLEASYVSMDADGFTINVSSASGTFDIAYEAYA